MSKSVGIISLDTLHKTPVNLVTLNQALKLTKIWAEIPTDHAYRCARGWWFMAEGLRYESPELQQAADLLLLTTMV